MYIPTFKSHKIKKNIIIITLVVFFFQDALQRSISIFQYFDEIVSIVAFIYFVVYLFNNNIQKTYLKTIYFMVAILIIGLIGNKLSGVVRTPSVILLDIFSVYKYFFVFLGANVYFNHNTENEKILMRFAIIIRFVILVEFVFLIISFFINIGMSGEIRYGIVSYKFIFYSAAHLSWYCSGYLIVLIADLGVSPNKNSKHIYILMALFIWLMTLRTRAFLYVMLFILLNIIIKKKDDVYYGINKRYYILMTVVGVLLAYDTIQKYFTNMKQARANFLVVGVKILIDSFPIGKGFATFGTYAARLSYSPVYYEYGLNRVWGMSENDSRFLSDNYWPAIMGQFGVIGILIMLGLLYITYRKMTHETMNNKYLYMATIFFILTSIGSSIATAIYFQPVILGYVFIVAIIQNVKQIGLNST